MEKRKIDLSVHTNAEASRNATAITGVSIMNTVLALAYLVEVLKGTRTIGSYIVLAAICVIPCVLSVLIYRRKPDALSIRYICGVGFLIFYTCVMFTTTTDLSFCYVLALYAILMVYVDMKLSIVLGGSAFVINVAVFVKKLVAGGISPVDITNIEVMLACILLTCLFSVLAITKVDKIGQANIEKAAKEREQSEKLLEKTLGVAASITENIESAVTETEGLNSAIGTTQRSMEDLSNSTNDTVQAIMEQQMSTNEINEYIRTVEASTGQIVEELENAEKNLNVGHEMMNELIGQVKISESSSEVVAKEMEGLKENAGRMQSIIGLIANVADQTSLLSLNASIEAARAGEAGRGFAVVASEISNLAAQTNSATEDINQLIESIALSIEEVTKALNALLESNRVQSECVGRTADNFDKIHSSTREISDQADKLKEAVGVVSDANAHVVESISNVSAVTEEVTASANETLDSCNMNLESIEKLLQIMEQLGAETKKLQQN